MHICIVNQYALPLSEPGGSRHTLLARELVKRGHQVTVIASNFNYSSQVGFAGTRTAQKETKEVSYVWVETPQYKGNGVGRIVNMVAFAARLVKRKVRMQLQRPDVIIGSSPQPFAAWAALSLSEYYRIPFIMEVRDLWPQTLIDLGSSRYHPFILFLSWLERHLYKKAARIIAVMPRAADYVSGLNIPTERVVWIPNGIDVSLVPQPTLNLEKRSHFVVMYAGTHGLSNGLDTVLEAARILYLEMGDQIAFRLIGDGPQKARLREKSEQEGIPNVTFEDPVPKTDIYRSLLDADAFVLPLKGADVFKYGINCNKMYDYLISARPVIFAVQAANNPVDEARAGFSVPPEDPVAMANAIKKLVAMPQSERFEMGLRGRKYVEKHHDIAILTDKLERLLYEVVNKGH